MTEFRKKFVVYIALYGVLVIGIIFFITSLTKGTTVEMISFLVSGVTLLLISLVLAKILKRIIHKRRPPEKSELFTPFDRYAFPSGHATGLSVISIFVCMHSIGLGIVSIVVSFFIMRARVQARVHDVYDMVGGIFVGTACAYLLFALVSKTVTPYLLTVYL